MSSLLKANLDVASVYVVKVVGIAGIVYLHTASGNYKHSTDYVWWPGGKMETVDMREDIAEQIVACASREWREETGTRLTGTVIDFVTGVVQTGRQLDKRRNAVFLIVRDNNMRFGEGFTTHEGTIRMMTFPQLEAWASLVETTDSYLAIIRQILGRIRQPIISQCNSGNLILTAPRVGVWPNVRWCNLCNVDYSRSDHVISQQHIFMLQRERNGCENEFIVWCDGKCNKRNVVDGLVWPSTEPSEIDACSTWIGVSGYLHSATHSHIIKNVVVNVCRTCGAIGNVMSETGAQKYLAGCGLTTEIVANEPAPPDDARGGPRSSTNAVRLNRGVLKEVEQVYDVMQSKD